MNDRERNSVETLLFHCTPPFPVGQRQRNAPSEKWVALVQNYPFSATFSSKFTSLTLEKIALLVRFLSHQGHPTSQVLSGLGPVKRGT